MYITSDQPILSRPKMAPRPTLPWTQAKCTEGPFWIQLECTEGPFGIQLECPEGPFWLSKAVWAEGPFWVWTISVGQTLHSAQNALQWEWGKLKWDLLRTSVTACTIDKNAFSAPFGIFYVKTEIWEQIFQKKFYLNPSRFQMGVTVKGFPEHFGQCFVKTSGICL